MGKNQSMGGTKVWKCNVCGNVVDDTMDECWKCGKVFDDDSLTENDEYNEHDDITINYVGFWKRSFASTTDALIMMPILSILYPKIAGYAFKVDSVWPIFLYYLGTFLVYIIFITQFGGTLGKLLFKIRIVNKDNQFLTIRQASLRLSPYLITGVITLWQLSIIISSAGLNELPHSAIEIGRLTTKYSGNFQYLVMIGNIFSLIDASTIIFSKKKRAIHDYIAGSYVIPKKYVARTRS